MVATLPVEEQLSADLAVCEFSKKEVGRLPERVDDASREARRTWP
jgi:hypothetical protein